MLSATQAATAEIRIGVVNVIKVMTEAPLAKTAQKQIEKDFAPREKKLNAFKKEILSLDEKLTRDGAIMSEDEGKKLERQIISKRRELKRLNDEFQEDLNIRKNEILSKLQKQINDALKALAKEMKFDIILGRDVLYFSPEIDVTDKLLAKLK